MSPTLIVVMVSVVSAYIQTHQVVHIKYVLFSVYQLYLYKAVKRQLLFLIHRGLSVQCSISSTL